MNTANENNAKTTMILMLRALQTADCHIQNNTSKRAHYASSLKAQGIDDIDQLIHDYIELMNTTK